MKYALFIYQGKDFNPKAIPGSEYKEVARQYAALVDTPNLKPGIPAGFPHEAVTVQVRDGVTTTTPGPYRNPGRRLLRV